MNYLAIIVITFLLVVIKFITVDSLRMQALSGRTIIDIAHKSYLAGCMDVSKDPLCHEKADTHKKDLESFLGKIGTN